MLNDQMTKLKVINSLIWSKTTSCPYSFCCFVAANFCFSILLFRDEAYNAFVVLFICNFNERNTRWYMENGMCGVVWQLRTFFEGFSELKIHPKKNAGQQITQMLTFQNECFVWLPCDYLCYSISFCLTISITVFFSLPHKGIMYILSLNSECFACMFWGEHENFFGKQTQFGIQMWRFFHLGRLI